MVTLHLVRKQPSRLTILCPVCGEQMALHVRFPIPEHRDVKTPEVIDWRCGSNCNVTEAQIRETLLL